MVVPYRCPPDEAGSYAARWQGARPAWLRGSVVRTCPALFSLPGWQSAHLFDGLGAMFAFRIADEPRLDWRFLYWRAGRPGPPRRPPPAPLLPAPRPPLWAHVVQPGRPALRP